VTDLQLSPAAAFEATIALSRLPARQCAPGGSMAASRFSHYNPPALPGLCRL
jgi:hypothetical protein